MQAPLGFRFGAVAAGMRKEGRLDVGLIAADQPSAAAGVFTRNIVRAAPVLLSARRLASGTARAILVNSGSANACTGEAGLQAALESTRAIAQALRVQEDEVLAASTGVIGEPLRAERIVSKAEALVQQLSPDPEGFSRAIMTTDRWPKLAERAVRDEAGGSSHLLGIAKGAGMIHPDLGELKIDGPVQGGAAGDTAPAKSERHATLLVFLLTDAAVDANLLQRCLNAAVEPSFNACTVDGDTSTNDTLLALASGRSGSTPTERSLTAAMTEVCRELARSVVRDGEGANHVMKLHVRGLADAKAAKQVAQTVATSLLVKTALHGRDPNWGRLLAAAGRAGVPFDPDCAAIEIGGVRIVANGLAVGVDAERQAAAKLAELDYTVTLTLGDGPGEFLYETCDLGHEYVNINADYRS